MKLNRIGESTVIFKNKPKIISSYSVVGKKEGEGPFKDYFDHILQDDLFGQKSYELAERNIMESAIFGAIDKGRISLKNIDFILGGDLLNQITSSSFSAREFEKPFLGLYSACSTMSESLAIGACMIDGGYARNVYCIPNCSKRSTICS